MGIPGGQEPPAPTEPRIARTPPPDQTYAPEMDPRIARMPPPDQTNPLPPIFSVISNSYAAPPVSTVEGSTRGSWDIDGTWKEAE